MENLNERVTLAITKSGHYATSVAKHLKISPEAVLQWMSGSTKTIKAENIFALADLTGYSARWLATGEGPQIDRYSSAAVQHVLSVMENLPPAEQAKFARLADAFIGPPANDHPPLGSVQQRQVDG